MPKHHARAVERSRRVQPVGVTDETLVAEHELLPARANREPAAIEISDIGVRETHIELVAERRASCCSVSPLYPRILRLNTRA